MLPAVVAIIAVLLSSFFISIMFFGGRKWDPKGKHCYITGGSSGTGLALATILVRRGAHVSIVARSKEKLDKALKELESVRTSPEQTIRAYSFAVDQAKGAADSIEAASEPFNGKSPDAMFLCAGVSRPGFFVEQTEESLARGMQESYWTQAWCALAGAKRMVKEGSKGKIVFVASVLGYFSIVGYSTYSPGKFALRGLAETLQSEFCLYGIDVHIYFPGTIYSPGYEEENRVKPKITLKIEESDAGHSPEEIAAVLLKGVERGDFHITGDFIGNVFRASARGSSPGNSSFVDQVYNLIGSIALPIWRRDVDKQVRAHVGEHREYLASKGFYTPESN